MLKALIGVWVFVGVWAPSPSAGQGNPLEGDEAAVRAGRALYEGRCSDCHGADAKGNRGADLTRLWAAGANDERVFQAIRQGVDGSIMPPSFAPDAELWAIVAYLRSISTVPPLQTTGDPEQGRELFESECAQCHRVKRFGGRLGPALTYIATVRSREALVRAVREPSAAVGQGFRAVTLVTRRGERVEGVVKSQDAFSIQIVDSDQRLQGYRMADLDEVVREDASTMPRFAPDTLSDRELEHLLAFLAAAAVESAAP